MKREKLSELCKEKGLSQQELAKKLSISSGAIAMYETGRRKPPLFKAIAIARFFNTQVEYLQFSNDDLFENE